MAEKILRLSILHLPWISKCSRLYINGVTCFSINVITLSGADRCPSYLSGSDAETLQTIRDNFVLVEDFLSEAEEGSLVDQIEPLFKRRRYEFDHWDGAIQGYKETENIRWNEHNQKILKRLRDIAFPSNVQQLQHVHVLDLSKDGYIKPHIDSVRFCGDIIAGMSLLSPSIMRLVKEDKKEHFVDILLHRRSLYIMKGDVRYKFTHEILEDKDSYFKGKHVPRNRRISVICRNEPDRQIGD